MDVHSNYSTKFFQLMRQIEHEGIECNQKYDSTTHSIDNGQCRYMYTGGTYRLGESEDNSSNTHNTTATSTNSEQRREFIAHLAEQRRQQQQQQDMKKRILYQ